MFRLGRMRSGRYFELPFELLKEDVKGYLARFTDLELVDILCLSEFHLLMQKQEGKSGELLDSIGWVGDFLLRKRLEPHFAKLLHAQGLHTSAAFIRHARTLIT